MVNLRRVSFLEFFQDHEPAAGYYVRRTAVRLYDIIECSTSLLPLGVQKYPLVKAGLEVGY